MTHTTTLAKMAKLIACLCALSTTVLWGTRLTYKGKYISVDTSSPTAGSHVLFTDRLQEATNFTVKNVSDFDYTRQHILFNNQFLAWANGTLQMRSKEDTTTTIWVSCPFCAPDRLGKFWNVANPKKGIGDIDKATDCELIKAAEDWAIHKDQN